MSDATSLVFEIEQATPMPLKVEGSCAAGELLALVGPSGAGKTSVLRVLAGLMKPQGGQVVVGDDVWFDSARSIFLTPRQRHVGLVFQNYALMPHLNACDNVALSLMHLPRAERQEKAQQWLHHVQLSSEQQRRRPSELSGGQQQRVAFARALAREPRLLLLDEPFSAVDQMTRRGLYELMAVMRKELSIPIVLVTHDLHEASLMADRLVVMDAGRVLQMGRPSAIHRSPRNARVADLVGIQNRFHGLWLGPADVPGWGHLQWLGAGPSGVAGPVLTVRDKGKIDPGQKVTWVIPGDGIELWTDEVEGTNHFDHHFESVVIDAQHLGEITLARLALQEFGTDALSITLSGKQRMQIQLGGRHRIRLDQELIHVMPFKGDDMLSLDP